ncbi:hypothetical protein tb265_28670 [Gemmatimonadetes bacterium T265]|nr:hypothetical protein tb265_28670 [Gemmatimonadetes bacterium T265]
MTVLDLSSNVPVMAEPNRVRRVQDYRWWLFAAVALLAGYADLARGGDVIAPVLLVLGYCVLVPLAIFR